jgi:hypothetical protein
MVVKLAASMVVCWSAARQSSEFPAKAIIANDVRVIVRTDDIACLSSIRKLVRREVLKKTQLKVRYLECPALKTP